MDENINLNHNIIMEDRKRIILTGIKDVNNFDEETITLDTHYGTLVIKGEYLHILNFNTEKEDLSVEGKIHALIYTSQEKNKSFISKIFR